MKPKVQLKQIRWQNHWCEPPDGLPVLLAQQVAETPQGQGAIKMPEIESLYAEHKPPKGYRLVWGSITYPPKRWSQDTRAKIRVNNLIKKMHLKFPLFADEFIAREIARRPSYYAGEQPADQQKFIEESDANDRKLFDDARNNVGLVVYMPWWG